MLVRVIVHHVFKVMSSAREGLFTPWAASWSDPLPASFTNKMTTWTLHNGRIALLRLRSRLVTVLMIRMDLEMISSHSTKITGGYHGSGQPPGWVTGHQGALVWLEMAHITHDQDWQFNEFSWLDFLL